LNFRLTDCSLPSFVSYARSGGIINCNDSPGACKVLNTDHVVVIAGWGVDAATGMPYWVGRNSYGTQVQHARTCFVRFVQNLLLRQK
jgi:hypothetical protein